MKYYKKNYVIVVFINFNLTFDNDMCERLRKYIKQN